MQIDHTRLRRALNRAALTAGVKEVIVPFGFETLGVTAFKKAFIARVYCYFYGSRSQEDHVLQEILAVLSSDYPELAAVIRWGITTDSIHPVGNSGSYLNLYVAGRMPPFGLLEGYSRHMVVSSSRLVAGTLPEYQDFHQVASARRFVYQVGILTQRLMQSTTWVEGFDDVFRAITRVPNRDWETGASVRCPATQEELRLREEIILPACMQFASTVCGDELVEFVDFNNGEQSHIRLDADAVSSHSKRIAAAYLDYVETAP